MNALSADEPRSSFRSKSKPASARRSLPSPRRGRKGASPPSPKRPPGPTERCGEGLAEKIDVGDRLAAIAAAADLDTDAATAAMASAVEAIEEPARDLEAAGWPQNRIAASAELVIRCAADIVPEPVVWLWPSRIAIGKQTIIAGEPASENRSCPALSRRRSESRRADLCRATRAWHRSAAPSSCRPRMTPQILSGLGLTPLGQTWTASTYAAVRPEDGKGRRAFNLQADLDLLENEIERPGDMQLVVIDPVSSYLGKVDSHKNAELRAVLEPIGEMASRLGVAVISVTHLSKGSGAANSRIIGSIGFVAVARAAFVVCRDPDDHERRLFLPTKNNLAKEGGGIGFRVGSVSTPSGIVAPAIFWDAMPVTLTADQALNTSHDTPALR